MNEIKRLDALTISKIAAGEVIDRPVSVVKELVENSIDAGATRIQVTLQRGGLDLIRVVDNGAGISSDQLALAITDHATSKIQSMEDLYSIYSMGFRGEALASIRHVSHLTVTSRVATVPLGAMITASGAHIGSPAPVAYEIGTQIQVMDLFRNMPVRQKFLKSAATEFSYVNELMIGMALLHPYIEFTLTHDGKEIINTIGVSSLEDRSALFWGKALRHHMLNIDFSLSEFRIQGKISEPSVTFSSRAKQIVSVNDRIIRSAVLQKAISQAMADTIPSGRFPGIVLRILVPPDQVDINIHPQKQDVRFVNSGFIFDLIVKAIRSAINERSAPRDPGYHLAVPMSVPTWGGETVTASHTEVLFRALQWPSAEPSASAVPFGGTFLQLFETYIVIDAGKSMLILDQHAVHERILYEQIKNRSAQVAYQQPLLAAQVISLTAPQYARCQEVLDAIRELGFEIEEFGANQIVIRQVPVTLAGPSPDTVVVALISQLMEVESSVWDQVLQDKDRLQRMACRAAIKAGKRMSALEVQSMIFDLIRSPNNFTCPHGRPLFIEWTKADFERMFLRT
jgi:DNA mismatch repair protein MutL